MTTAIVSIPEACVRTAGTGGLHGGGNGLLGLVGSLGGKQGGPDFLSLVGGNDIGMGGGGSLGGEHLGTANKTQ